MRVIPSPDPGAAHPERRVEGSSEGWSTPLLSVPPVTHPTTPFTLSFRGPARNLQRKPTTHLLHIHSPTPHHPPEGSLSAQGGSIPAPESRNPWVGIPFALSGVEGSQERNGWAALLPCRGDRPLTLPGAEGPLTLRHSKGRAWGGPRFANPSRTCPNTTPPPTLPRPFRGPARNPRLKGIIHQSIRGINGDCPISNFSPRKSHLKTINYQ